MILKVKLDQLETVCQLFAEAEDPLIYFLDRRNNNTAACCDER